jgi:hypothetical protein
MGGAHFPSGHLSYKTWTSNEQVVCEVKENTSSAFSV